MKIRINFLIYLFLGFFLSSCASKYLKYEKADTLKKNDEFEQQVQIIAPTSELLAPQEKSDENHIIAPPLGAGTHDLEKSDELKKPEDIKPIKKKSVDKSAEKKLKIASAKKTKKIEESVKELRRQPEFESDVGFNGRRPIKDPFRVGERVVHTVSYLGVSAGKLALDVKPFAQVNGQKSYQFQISIWSNTVFSAAYSVDDKSVILMDYETLIPSVFSIHVKESGQLREARALFNREKGQATFWDKKVTTKEGAQERKLQWDIPDYTQNVFSSIFYLRFFTWDLGVEHSFRVTDETENLIFKAKAIRKEKISTDVGDFNTIVIKPQVELRGIAKPVGDMFIWLSDDDRKLILKIKADVKIGSLVSEVSELELGRED